MMAGTSTKSRPTGTTPDPGTPRLSDEAIARVVAYIRRWQRAGK